MGAEDLEERLGDSLVNVIDNIPDNASILIELYNYYGFCRDSPQIKQSIVHDFMSYVEKSYEKTRVKEVKLKRVHIINKILLYSNLFIATLGVVTRDPVLFMLGGIFAIHGTYKANQMPEYRTSLGDVKNLIEYKEDKDNLVAIFDKREEDIYNVLVEKGHASH